MSTLQVAVPCSDSEFSILITQQMKACGERVVAKPTEATKPLASQEAKLRIPEICSQLHIRYWRRKQIWRNCLREISSATKKSRRK